jgi:LuxR family maltose regulon positive regulatory protein
MPHSDSRLVDVRPVAPFDLLETKVRVPAVAAGSVSRTTLINHLRASDACSLATVLAPAGYGKTTVLAQWADRDSRPFVWVTIDDDDDDPLVLSRYVAWGMYRARLIDSSASDLIGSAGQRASAAVSRLASGLLAAEEPFVLVLDNVHLLRSRQSARTVSTLAEHIPDGSTLVLAGRALPRLPIARVRTSGRLLEVGVEQLALSQREVELLLRAVDVDYDAEDVAELTDRTEGWPVGAYLAALALKDGSPKPGCPSVEGDDRFVADYFDFELLSRLAPRDVRFLTRTAVLDRMCGSLCDAVLETTGSARKLESIARANLFLVPLDRRRGWYRYHHEFREFLRAELERREPELVTELNRRAATWYEASGAHEAGIPHARAADDFDRLARLVAGLALPVCSSGRAETVERWLDWFDDELVLEQYPIVSVLGAWVHVLRGRPAAAKRCLDAAEVGKVGVRMPDGSRSLEPWTALLRAAMCQDGVEQMRADAEVAVRHLGASSRWRPAALVVHGVAKLLLGEEAEGDESLAEAAETAGSMGATSLRAVALAERCLLATTREDTTEADSLVQETRDLIGESALSGDPMSALAYAACGRQALRRGDLSQARTDLAKAHGLAAHFDLALPWYSVQTNLEIARADLAQLDAPGARVWLAAADEILRRRPQLGDLAAQSRALNAEANRVAALSEGRGAGLTSAELRLLPLLGTHLSFREIAQRFFVSRNTVKTQAISVYRKLNASSRSEAIARATELGLVDPATMSAAAAITPSG